jgi:hypothetical protein
MPEPEITVRKLVGLQQLSRWPCPDCEQPAWTDHHGDVAGHLDPAHDKVCPESVRREKSVAALTLRLEDLREAFRLASESELRPDPPPVFSTRHRAEAYETSLRDADHRQWSEMLGNSVHQMALEHVRKLDEMLAAMPIGYRLCVHVPEWLTVPDESGFEHAATTRMRIRQKAHMLGPDETCEAVPFSRVEYGPKR